MVGITKEEALGIFRSALEVEEHDPARVDETAAKRWAIICSRFADYLNQNDFLELGRVHIANIALITRYQAAQYTDDVLNSAYLSAVANSEIRAGAGGIKKDIAFVTGSAALADKDFGPVELSEGKLAHIKAQSSDRRVFEYATNANRPKKADVVKGVLVPLQENQLVNFMAHDGDESPYMTIESIAKNELVVRLFDPRSKKEQFLTVQAGKEIPFGREGVSRDFFVEFEGVQPYSHIHRHHFLIQHDGTNFNIVAHPSVNDKRMLPVVYDRPVFDDQVLKNPKLLPATIEVASVGTDMAHLIDPKTYRSAIEKGNIIVALTPDGIPHENAMALESHLKQKLFPGKVFRTDVPVTGQYIVYVNTGPGTRSNVEERKQFVAQTIAENPQEISFNLADLPTQSFKVALADPKAYKVTADKEFIRLPIESNDLDAIGSIQSVLNKPPYNIYTQIKASADNTRFVLQLPVGFKKDDANILAVSNALFAAVNKAMDDLPSYIKGVQIYAPKVAAPQVAARQNEQTAAPVFVPPPDLYGPK